MGKQKGVVVLSGTIDGVNFYVSKGKALMRKAGGGFTSESLKSNPKMERARENSSEFGMASRAKKLFRMGMDPFLYLYRDVSLHGRMVQLFQKIKNLDMDSERGKRKVSIGLTTPMGQLLLRQFSISERQVITTLLANSKFDATTDSYLVSDFDASRIIFPEGATALEVLFGVLVFDFDALDYELFMAPSVVIDSGFLASSFVLSPSTLPVGSGVKVAVACVRFHQVVGGIQYPLSALSHQGISIVGVSG